MIEMFKMTLGIDEVNLGKHFCVDENRRKKIHKEICRTEVKGRINLKRDGLKEKKAY